MIGDPINLNKFRKTKAKVDKSGLAHINRVKFGRTKEEKTSVKARCENMLSNLDAHKIENDPR